MKRQPNKRVKAVNAIVVSVGIAVGLTCWLGGMYSCWLSDRHDGYRCSYIGYLAIWAIVAIPLLGIFPGGLCGLATESMLTAAIKKRARKLVLVRRWFRYASERLYEFHVADVEESYHR